MRISAKLPGYALVALCLAVIAAPQAAEAQQAGKIYTIGTLSTAAGPSSTYGPIVFNTLRDRGYERGRNLVVEARFAAGRVDQLPDLAADLVRRKVDVILAFGSSESLAALKATSTIPIVFTSVSPVELGLVRSLARPGGNATGLSIDVTPEIAGKFLELLKTTVPRLSRVAIVVDPARPGLAPYERTFREAAHTLRVEVHPIPVRDEADLDAAFTTMTRDRPDALVLAADPLIYLHRKRVADFAAKHRLPTIAGVREFVDDGALMSYGPNLSDLLRRLVSYADKILKGARPADLPVEQPTRFELVVNLKTAKSLGLTIPPSVLLRADEVLQ